MEQQVYEQFNQLESKHWWFCGRRKYIEKIILKFLPAPPNKLTFCEVGSGTGGNLPLLTQFAIVDSVEMNDSARSLIEDKKIPGVRDIHSGHLPDGMKLSKQYDAVFCLDVIEHIEDDLAALIKLKSFINQDGWLITTVPAYQWLWSAHDIANHHKRRYTKEAYTQLMSQAGYTTVYSSYFNTLLFPLAAIARLIEKLKPDNISHEKVSLTLPNSIINNLLKKIFEIESYWAGKLSMWFGLSIIVVAKPLQPVDSE